jgi:amino acid transporter
VAIIIQSVTALIAAIFGTLSMLVATSVFFLSAAYLATSLSIYSLRKKYPNPKRHVSGGAVIPFLAAVLSLVLISQCTVLQIELGLALLLAGVPIYIFYSPQKELTEVKNALLRRASILRRARITEQRFLAHLLYHVKRLFRRITE